MRILRPLALTLLLALTAVPANAANPDALWQIVHDRCVPDQQANDQPAPCALVELNRGYAVLKDIVGATQFLLIPTAKITGIEDPAILSPMAPNYFAAAWRARAMVEQRAQQTLPRDALSLAINSAYGRTQNQLHIHIDCLRRDVAAALRQGGGSVGSDWAPFPVKLLGHPYLARRVASDDLADNNPFMLLADSVPGARADMGEWTLVAAGATIASATTAPTPGFILLADHVDATIGDHASGEELQDHACAIKTQG
jgi:CDP-diacylglycerol pyrophosphatase